MTAIPDWIRLPFKMRFPSYLILIFLFPAVSYSHENLIYTSEEDTRVYYQQLITQPIQDLKLEDFNRTFAPISIAPDPTSEGFLKCRSIENSYYSPDCMPDTFYSWGPQNKLENIKSATRDIKWKKQLNPGHYFIFMAPTSIGSYCYGRYPVRYKTQGIISTSTLFRGWKDNTFFDFMINGNDNQNLLSASFGQPEHFDEMVTEIQRRLDIDAPWNTTNLYHSPTMNNDTLKTKLLTGCVPEVYQMEEKVLVENLVEFLKIVLSNSGWIHFQNCENCDRSEHFKTNWPTFFNPQ